MFDLQLDKTKNALAAFIRAVVGSSVVGGRMDYLAMYPCVVASQNADGSLELKPDDSRLGPGFSSIPLRLGIPGCTVTLGTPTRCLLGWYGGDPSKPFAALFEGSTVTELDFNGTTIKLGTPASDFLVKGNTYRSAEDTWFTAISAGFTALAALVAGGPAAVAPVATALATFNAASATYLSAKSKVG